MDLSGDAEPQGILNSPALITIAKESGQVSGTVIAVNIEKMLAAFWAASYNSDGACWLYNQALLPQLSSLATIVGTGGSESKLWQWATADNDYDRLAGFPAIMSEYCQVPGTPGDLILCDFSRYVIAMREELRAEHPRPLSIAGAGVQVCDESEWSDHRPLAGDAAQRYSGDIELCGAGGPLIFRVPLQVSAGDA